MTKGLDSITCAQCGISFVPKTKNQKYCDKDCTRIATNLRLMAAYRAKKVRLQGAPRECKDCGTPLNRYLPEDTCVVCSRKRHKTKTSKRVLDEVREATRRYGR